ncbi:MAG: 4'-phosphopantetheinyl transferase superfamily protein [Lachnospiraceae bacterium]|nr:4'-phosphopantetheinyl transferase superfamily protein [Lachnospiraceae bacterium]
MAKVYVMAIEAVKGVPDDFFRMHFPDRFEKMKRFRFHDDRYRSAAAAVLLYSVPGLEEKDISVNEYGKPFSKKCPGFSLSHSGGYAALGIASGLIGIDIEKTDKDYLDIMPQVFTKEEIRYVGRNLTAFYKVWTLKESLAKAVGTGLQMTFKDISVLPFLEGRAVSCQGALWYGHAEAFDDGAYVIACVTQSNEELMIINKEESFL